MIDQTNLTKEFYRDYSALPTQGSEVSNSKRNIPLNVKNQRFEMIEEEKEEQKGILQINLRNSRDVNASNDEELFSEEQDPDQDEDQQFRPGQMVDLWKNLQDLLRNQFKEECQVVRDKNKKLQ